MPSHPSANGKQVLRALEKFGFKVSRISRGSHHILRKAGQSSIVVVPVHGNQIVPRGTMQSILRQAGLDADEFFEMI
jgi:predicted RNA binding protein YcfA (HicA-like mRNA interferase family)